MVTKSKNSIDPGQGFSERLHAALDALEGFPRKHKGRQEALAKLFKVTGPAAYKWLSGKNFPQQAQMPEFESKLKVSAAWLWTGSGNPELEPRSSTLPVAATAAGTSLAAPRVVRLLTAISQGASAGRLSEADLDLLQVVAERLQAKIQAQAFDDLPHLTPAQVRLDDLYRQAQAFEPAQLLTLAKKLQAEAQQRAGDTKGKGKHHAREAGAG